MNKKLKKPKKIIYRDRFIVHQTRAWAYTENDSICKNLAEFDGPFSDHFFLDPISLRIVIEDKAPENAYAQSPTFSHFESAWVYTRADSICKKVGDLARLF